MSLSESKQDEPQQKPPRWRQDFPIKWESDHYITRRELAKFLALGSALLAGASAVLVTAGRLFRPQRFPRARIAAVSSIAQPGSLLFRYPTAQDPCILVRTAEGKLEAYSQVCTHLSCAVVYWKQENTLFCPCHRGRSLMSVPMTSQALPPSTSSRTMAIE